MLYKFNNTLVNTIGDPHLGKDFKEGVPLHRRGEREASQFEQFERELNVPCDINVMMGDIFDKFRVDESVILKTYFAYQRAVEANPRTLFVVIRGNHDMSKDSTLKSSFDVLHALLENYPTVRVVTDIEMEIGILGDAFMFIGVDPLRNSRVQVADLHKHLLSEGKDHNYFQAIFGHWDTESFGGEDHQLIPLEFLTAFTRQVVTGHEHNLARKQMDEVNVIVTGSMQPYGFDQDTPGEMYVTKSLNEVLDNLRNYGEDYYRNKCLKVFLPPGQNSLPEIDCLQLKTVQQHSINEDGAMEARMEDFSFQDLFFEHLKGYGLPDDVVAQLWTDYQEVNSNV